ncbi:MAG: DUF4432 family protein [Spirochaetes bacterium]|nr:DUF4432 family protein [Spirochaetota bacterium]
MSTETVVHLHHGFFGEAERRLVSHGTLSAAAFTYPGGVAGLRLANERGAIVVLPWQGQQVWDAAFDGRTLTMKSMFDRPRPTREYLATYGAFLVHCGATAMGVPSAARGDAHPLHGELPNALYDSAFVAAGTDARGRYLAVGGEYRHTLAFTCNYVARPLVKLYEGSTMLSIAIGIENLKRTPMDLMYMAHVNFRPLDGGRLVYSAPCTPKTVRVRGAPTHIPVPPGHAEFLQELARDPSRHNVLSPGLAFDPEVVLYLNYLADSDGWAHSMMVHPDGYASCIRHRPSQLRHGVRWISRTPDQDCLGVVLPATAEPEGYAAEKTKGNVGTLAAAATVRYEMEAGLLTPDEAKAEEAAIGAILAAGR